MSNAQNLNLHPKGIGYIVIGETLDTTNKQVQSIEKHPRKTKIVTGFTNVYDYFFLDTHSLQSKINDSIDVEEFFIATDKQGTVIGIVAYIYLRDVGKATQLIESEFGPIRLGASSGAEGQTHRLRQMWSKDAISLILTQNIGLNKVELYMEAYRKDMPGLNIYVSNVLH